MEREKNPNHQVIVIRPPFQIGLTEDGRYIDFLADTNYHDRIVVEQDDEIVFRFSIDEMRAALVHTVNLLKRAEAIGPRKLIVPGGTV